MTMQPIPDQADVVIIGGGIFGVSVAYHLLRLGAGRVVLLEREAELAAATSAAAAGFIAPWSLGAGAPNLELSLERYGMQLYRELANRYDLDFQPVGLAHIATTEASDTALRETYQAHKRRGTGEVVLLTPAELHERAPIVAANQIRSTLFVPSGFSITASKAVRALGSELAALGGAIRLGTPVTDILIDGSVVRGVVTPDGVIVARTVVIAAGPWLGQVARLAALDLPLIPTQASRFVTAALPEVPTTMPMLMFPAYHNLYLRAEAEGLLVGCEEIVVHPPTLAHDLGRLRRGEQPSAIGVGVSPVADTTHHYHLWLARAFAAVVPALGTCAVREVRYGASSRVPDMRHILGRAGELGNLYLIGADLECGMTRGPGLGKVLAELIVHEQPTLDVTAYQLER